MSSTFTHCVNNFTNVTRLQEIDTFDLPKCQQGEFKVLLSTFSRKKVALSREWAKLSSIFIINYASRRLDMCGIFFRRVLQLCCQLWFLLQIFTWCWDKTNVTTTGYCTGSWQRHCCISNFFTTVVCVTYLNTDNLFRLKFVGVIRLVIWKTFVCLIFNK